MMKLYWKNVLSEKPQNDLVPLGSLITPAPKAAEKEEVGSFGD